MPKQAVKCHENRENKNTIMKLWHPFMPKQVGKGREREKKKNCRSAPFLPDAKLKISKKQQKN